VKRVWELGQHCAQLIRLLEWENTFTPLILIKRSKFIPLMSKMPVEFDRETEIGIMFSPFQPADAVAGLRDAIKGDIHLNQIEITGQIRQLIELLPRPGRIDNPLPILIRPSRDSDSNFFPWIPLYGTTNFANYTNLV